MILDGHIHIYDDQADAARFEEALRSIGFDGGILFSMPPPVHKVHGKTAEYKRRVDHVVSFAKSASPRFFPFFWIDPAEKDALSQVDYAVESGIAGFKVICSKFFPSEKFAMEVFAKIAAAGKPLVFHSGVLGDDSNSSKYCRPMEYECLVEIENIRFSLAHIGWPWCDEVVALFGKIHGAAKHYGLNAEMFVDMTPGTPGLYRKEVIPKCFVYPVGEHLIFGSDSNTSDYLREYSRSIIDDDVDILRSIGVSEETIENVKHKNLVRFVEGRR